VGLRICLQNKVAVLKKNKKKKIWLHLEQVDWKTQAENRLKIPEVWTPKGWQQPFSI
jgi:hypothetical protein